MDFKDYLLESGMDPDDEDEKVLFLRHAPGKKRFPVSLRDTIFQAANGPARMFNVYQQIQENTYVEKQMKEEKYVAAFLGDAPGEARFVGLYLHRREGDQHMTQEQISKLPEIKELKSQGLPAISRACICFDLQLQENFLPDSRLQLKIKWPDPDLVWHRWGHEWDFEVID